MIERLKEIKDYYQITQKEFAQKIGVKPSSFSDIVNGRTKLTDRNIDIICEKFHINKQWLETGTGTMLKEISSDTEISDYIAELLKNEDMQKANQIKDILSIYLKLDEGSKQVVEDLMHSLLENKKK